MEPRAFNRDRWSHQWLRVYFAAIAFVFVAAVAHVAQAKEAPDSFADLAQRLLPSVVNVSTTQIVEGNSGVDTPMAPPGSPFDEFFKEFMDRNQGHPRQHRATSLGSGFIIDTQGHVVTNNHVIQDADEITVILHDETRLPAKVIGRDQKTDIAVLKIEPTVPLQPLTFGDSDGVRVGDWILAIGNPFGFGGTVTAGIISARGRDIETGPYDDFLQTDASINRGNSGGPMFNLKGEVIGINTAIYSPSGGSVGIGFAIPSNNAKPVIDQLIATGQVKRGWLGVRIQAVTDEIAESLGLKSASGALVASVVEKGPAAEGDIRAGDVILKFDGKTIDQMRRLPRIVADTEVGRTVDVTVWRDNKEKTIRVKIAALKEEDEKVADKSSEDNGKVGTVIKSLGLTVAAIDERIRERFDLDDDVKGVIVTDVDPAGAAAAKGMKPGERIVEVSQEPVSKPQDISAKVDAAKSAGRKSVLMLVEGDAGLRFVAVRIDQG